MAGVPSGNVRFAMLHEGPNVASVEVAFSSEVSMQDFTQLLACCLDEELQKNSFFHQLGSAVLLDLAAMEHSADGTASVSLATAASPPPPSEDYIYESLTFWIGVGALVIAISVAAPMAHFGRRWVQRVDEHREQEIIARSKLEAIEVQSQSAQLDEDADVEDQQRITNGGNGSDIWQIEDAGSVDGDFLPPGRIEEEIPHSN